MVGQGEGRLGTGRGETGAETWMCIKGTEAEGRASRSAEKAVASRRDGIEEQRGRLGGRVANIGFRGQQGRDVSFHGKAGQVPVSPAGEWREQKGRNQSEGPAAHSPESLSSSPRIPRPPLTPGSSPALSPPLCQTPGAIPTQSAPDT